MQLELQLRARNDPPSPAASLPPASAGGFATSARRRHVQQPHRSRPSRARDGLPGSKNKHRAKRHDVGKTVKRAESIKEHQAC
jgi:hypothetical protein